MHKALKKLSIASLLAPMLVEQVAANDTIYVSEGSFRKTISSRPAAGYFKIQNSSDSEIIITAASSEFAKRIELHAHKMEDGVMSMIKLPSVRIESQSSLEFRPGHHHLMIFGLEDGELPEQGLPVRLSFETGEPKLIWLKAKSGP